MKAGEALSYIAICLLVYLGLCLFDVFVLRHFLDIITTDFWPQFVVTAVLFLVVNPVLTYRLSEKLPFAVKGLKVAQGLDAFLHHEVKLSKEKQS